MPEINATSFHIAPITSKYNKGLNIHSNEPVSLVERIQCDACYLDAIWLCRCIRSIHDYLTYIFICVKDSVNDELTPHINFAVRFKAIKMQTLKDSLHGVTMHD